MTEGQVAELVLNGSAVGALIWIVVMLVRTWIPNMQQQSQEHASAQAARFDAQLTQSSERFDAALSTQREELVGVIDKLSQNAVQCQRQVEDLRQVTRAFNEKGACGCSSSTKG